MYPTEPTPEPGHSRTLTRPRITSLNFGRVRYIPIKKKLPQARPSKTIISYNDLRMKIERGEMRLDNGRVSEIIGQNLIKVRNFAYNTNPNNLKMVLPRRLRKMQRHKNASIKSGKLVKPEEKASNPSTQMPVELQKMKRQHNLRKLQL